MTRSFHDDCETKDVVGVCQERVVDVAMCLADENNEGGVVVRELAEDDENRAV